jgi:hypothetical protein
MQALLHAATHRERLAELQIRLAQKGRAFIHFHHTACNIASAYALMHRDDLAIQWLQTAARQGFPCYPVFARDPDLTNLKNDLRFAQFIADQKKTVGILQDGALTRCGIGGPSSHIVPV